MRSRPSADCAYSPTGRLGVDSIAPPSDDRTQRINIAGGKGHDAGVAIALGDQSRAERYSSPRSDVRRPEVPNFRAAMKITLGISGQTVQRARFQQIAGDGFDSLPSQFAWQIGSC